MRWVLAVVVVAACSQGIPRPPAPALATQPAPTPPPAAPPPPRPATSPVTAATVCDRLAELETRCPSMEGMGADRAACLDEFREEIHTEATQKVARCLFDHEVCDDIVDCIVDAQPDPSTPGGLRGCHDDRATRIANYAVGLPRPEWDRRNGAGMRLFHDARSTKAAPIEMCSIPGANQWLTTLRCDDGSQPIKDRRDAEDARSGNLGRGGRCHSIIDRYLVPCPEQRYEIFIDAYICPRPD